MTPAVSGHVKVPQRSSRGVTAGDGPEGAPQGRGALYLHGCCTDELVHDLLRLLAVCFQLSAVWSVVKFFGDLHDLAGLRDESFIVAEQLDAEHRLPCDCFQPVGLGPRFHVRGARWILIMTMPPVVHAKWTTPSLQLSNVRGIDSLSRGSGPNTASLGNRRHRSPITCGTADLYLFDALPVSDRTRP